MPNIATLLKEEIARITRKELRKETGNLKKASAHYRSDIAALKRRIAELEQQVARLGKQAARNAAAQKATADAEGSRVRFSAKGFATQRRKLGLSATDMGRLLGVSGQTVYGWESGKTKPRQSQLGAIAAARGLGKREAKARLEKLTASRNA